MVTGMAKRARQLQASDVGGDEAQAGPVMLSLADAAQAIGVLPKSMRRILTQGRIPGAEKGDDGRWLVPVVGLQAAGYEIRTGRAPRNAPQNRPGSTETSAVEPDTGEMDRLREAVAQAEKRAVDAERRAAVAEALADERAVTLDDLRVTLRAMESALPKAGETSTAQAEAPPRRRLFGRG